MEIEKVRDLVEKYLERPLKDQDKKEFYREDGTLEEIIRGTIINDKLEEQGEKTLYDDEGKSITYIMKGTFKKGELEVGERIFYDSNSNIWEVEEGEFKNNKLLQGYLRRYYDRD